MSRRALFLALGLLAVQAVLLRTVFVPAPHPGGDNAAYLTLSHSLLAGQGYTELWDPAAPPHTKYPPVFPLLIAVTMALGARGWGSLKAAPAALSLVGVLAVFLWARRRVRDEVAAGVAFLTGLSAAYLDHARWILSDIPFVAFVFLALWLLEGLLPVPASGWTGIERDGSPGPGEAPDPEADGSPSRSIHRWLVLGGATVLVVAAVLTRSAGLPLAVAAVAALALHRRWPGAGLVGGAAALAGGLWALRARTAVGQGAYQSEFRLLDPYQPDLGTACVGDFVDRVWGNATGYLQLHAPRAFFDDAVGVVAAFGIAVVVLAVVGWALHLRRPGVAELFVPLYVGVLLLWPEVWSGTRFVIPLVPLLLLYGARGLSAAVSRIPRLQPGVPLLLGGLTVAILSGRAWTQAVSWASSCRAAVTAAGPWSCAGTATVDFVTAARFSGAALPSGAVALTRKPRIWYLMSGIPTRTYPFSEADGALLEAAGDVGARYVLLDAVGPQGLRFVGSAVVARPDHFCGIQAFGRAQAPVQLLGILPQGGSGSRRGPEGLELASCAPAMAGDVEAARAVFQADPELRRIPLLDAATGREGGPSGAGPAGRAGGS